MNLLALVQYKTIVFLSTPNIMEELVNILTPYLDNPWVKVGTAVVTLASAIAATTPTPKPGSLWAKVYAVIDFLALNIGKAKQTGK